MANGRSPGRNIHIYNASDQTLLAGHCQSEENLFFTLKHILLVVDQAWTLRHRASGRAILPSNNRAETGDYDAHCDGAIRLTDEAWVARVMSHSDSGGENSLRNGIWSRDGRCVISGLVNLLAPHRWQDSKPHIYSRWRRRCSGGNLAMGAGLQTPKKDQESIPLRMDYLCHRICTRALINICFPSIQILIRQRLQDYHICTGYMGNRSTMGEYLTLFVPTQTALIVSQTIHYDGTLDNNAVNNLTMMQSLK
ncbi:hypothetical protein I7I51_02691 [Histoplasma capsulatum]|uniref:DUF7881 domain-containing protein n=1 Tax=Ajellomyces capsulatus TaxID=5037 RepID=A0A8A1MP37_AJECA|nr:hypothetical protein I7I51_02691 [Histoplasma capsulatum]